METEIRIETSDDWKKIPKVVVDPMVFRTADVFLRGLKGIEKSPDKKEPEQMWSAIRSNIGSLCAFFDAVILEDRLPMYDYKITFTPDLYHGKHTLVELCNRDQPVLVSVTVGLEAYRVVKEAAIAALVKLPPVPAGSTADILREMSAFDWEWRPDLWRDETRGSENEQRLDAFRYGGLLFSGYSQLTGADHILQHKRARLYLAASLGSNRANDEEALFQELARISGESGNGLQPLCELPQTPTFLPYLLKFDDESPEELLNRALALRNKSFVKEYRGWRQAIASDLDKGRVSVKWEKEINQIAAAIRKELKADKQCNVTLSLSYSGIVPEAQIEKELNLAETLGWFLRQLPGRRYRKLLMRMVIAQREYTRVDKHLNKLWRAA